jgi:hypothetical protein
MRRLSFTEHPASVGETYNRHMASAWSFSVRMAVGALACLMHGLPRRTGSDIINELHGRMVLKSLGPHEEWKNLECHIRG